MKVIVFLKSGNQMTIECEEATFTNDSMMDITAYSIKKPKGSLHIDVKQIEAWQTVGE